MGPPISHRPTQKWNLENGPPLESSGTMRWRPSAPKPLPQPSPPTAPYHQASQYQDPKQNTKGKGFQRERGGSRGFTEIIEITKEYKGNSSFPRLPPQPKLPCHHRRPSTPNVPLELSGLWRGVHVPESWESSFLKLPLPASSSVSIGTPLSPWDPPSRIAEPKS